MSEPELKKSSEFFSFKRFIANLDKLQACVEPLLEMLRQRQARKPDLPGQTKVFHDVLSPAFEIVWLSKRFEQIGFSEFCEDDENLNELQSELEKLLNVLKSRRLSKQDWHDSLHKHIVDTYGVFLKAGI